MPISAMEAIQRDEMAGAVARALALANEQASAHGVPVERSLVTITEQTSAPRRLWHIHYGPRDYINRRGGDFTVIVDAEAGMVDRILRGQ